MEINDIIDLTITDKQIFIWIAVTIGIFLLLLIISKVSNKDIIGQIAIISIIAWISFSAFYYEKNIEHQKIMLEEKINNVEGINLPKGISEEQFKILLYGKGYCSFELSTKKKFYDVIAENNDNYIKFYYKRRGAYIPLDIRRISDELGGK